MSTILAARIRALREERGWTQKHAAELLGMSSQRLNNYEAGRHEPDLRQVGAMAALYNVSVDYLLGVTNDRTPYDNDGVDPEVAMRIQGLPRLTPEAKADLLKALDWIERDIKERKRRGEL